MKRSQLCTSIIIALTVTFMCNRTEASLFYGFEEAGSGTVLATLELASLPATHTEVLGLTFTPAGQSLLGFGESYLGTFDRTYGDEPAQMIADGGGGLRSSTPGNWTRVADWEPPPCPCLGIHEFSISASDSLAADYLSYFSWAFPPFINYGISGDWRVIPEPSADFDNSGIVDGHDFLKWQRGETPGLGSADELALWESQYGTTLPAVMAVVSTPEPSALLLASLAGLLFCSRRRRV